MRLERTRGGWWLGNGFIPEGACPHAYTPCAACLDEIAWVIGVGPYAEQRTEPQARSEFVTLSSVAGDIEAAKANRAKRDAKYGKKLHYAGKGDRRWPGDLAEIRSVHWLKGLGVPCSWITKDAATEPDIRIDLRPPSFVEAKCAVRNVPPLLSYASGIQACQAQPQRPNLVILFASYEIERDRMTLVGAIRMGEFLRHAKLFKKGQKVNANFARAHYDLLNIDNERLTPPLTWARSLRP